MYQVYTLFRYYLGHLKVFLYLTNRIRRPEKVRAVPKEFSQSEPSKCSGESRIRQCLFLIRYHPPCSRTRKTLPLFFLYRPKLPRTRRILTGVSTYDNNFLLFLLLVMMILKVLDSTCDDHDSLTRSALVRSSYRLHRSVQLYIYSRSAPEYPPFSLHIHLQSQSLS